MPYDTLTRLRYTTSMQSGDVSSRCLLLSLRTMGTMETTMLCCNKTMDPVQLFLTDPDLGRLGEIHTTFSTLVSPVDGFLCRLVRVTVLQG